MTVSVFGLGYVGCVTAACLARDGHRVIGVDVNPEKVALVNEGRSPVVEPGLDALLAEAVEAGWLTATGDPAEAIAASDLALICVGTPGAAAGRPDVSALERVGADIGKALAGRTGPFTVVLRSTVLPGTTQRVLRSAIRETAGATADVRLAVNPEFMREGSSIHDFDHPPMILVGAEDVATAGRVASLYAGVRAPVVRTAIRTAEVVKFASNAFHALKVCFANEMAEVCGALGADAGEVMRIFALDRKLNISDAYLRPGFAFGGSCLPKDVRALLWAARVNDVDTPVLAAIGPSNQGQIQRAIDTVLATRRRKVGVAGLAFKPGTDDLRESPVVTLVEALIGKGCDVRILDRHVSVARLVGANRRYIEGEIPHIASLLCDDAETLAGHAEVLVLGSAGEDASAALALAAPTALVVDLTRGGVKAVREPAAAVGA